MYAQSRTLYCVYDLSVSPITFDVLNFTVMAEMARLSWKLDNVHFVYLLGQDRKFRMATPKDHSLDQDEKLWRLRQILGPSSWLLESCNGCSIFLDRNEGARFLASIPPSNLFPNNYHFNKPSWAFLISQINKLAEQGHNALSFTATKPALAYVDRWIENNGLVGKPLVSLTLRMSDIEPERNCNIEAWTAFSREIEERGYAPVIVPDTDVTLRAKTQDYATDIPHFWTGPINLELRAALYARSHVSMSQNGGPTFINLFMDKTAYAGFLPVDSIPAVFNGKSRAEGGTAEGIAGMERVLGIKAGELFAFSSNVQRLVWKSDTLENIRAEFNDITERLSERENVNAAET